MRRRRRWQRSHFSSGDHMEILTIPISAGELKTYAIAGQYIEVLRAADASLDVILYGPSGAVESARGGEGGTWMKEAFTSFTVQSTIAQTLRLLVTGREGGSRRSAGEVSVTNVNGAFSQATVNATNAAGGVQLRPANADRRYLLVQNRDAVNSLYVTLDGSAPTAALGVLVEPGGSLELSGFACTGAVRALASGATAAAVVVEG